MDIELDLSVCLVMQSALTPLRGLLVSLEKNSDPVAHEIILVYTSLQKPAADLLAAEFPRLTPFETDLSGSLAALRNHAARIALGRYLLFCSDDILIKPGSLLGLLRFMDNTPDIGIAGPRIVDRAGALLPSARTFPSLATVFLQHSCLGKLMPSSRIINTHLMTEQDHLEPFEADWLLGSFLVLRRELLEDIGLFDEGFVSLYADADLCLRAKLAGWHTQYLAGAVVMHDRPEIYDPIHSLASPVEQAFSDSARFLLKKWTKPAKMVGAFRGM